MDYVKVRTANGWTLVTRREEAAMTSATLPEWGVDGLREALEHGVRVSRARAMQQLACRMGDLSDGALWAAMNVTARKRAAAHLDEAEAHREYEARSAEWERQHQHVVGTIEAAFAARGPLVVALERTLSRHAVGMKSEDFRVGSALLCRVAEEFGVDLVQVRYFPVWELGGHRVTVSFSDPVRPMEADVVDVCRSGSRHPNRERLYVAPPALTDAQAEVYEVFRESGLSPAEAEQAALAV